MESEIPNNPEIFEKFQKFEGFKGNTSLDSFLFHLKANLENLEIAVTLLQKTKEKKLEELEAETEKIREDFFEFCEKREKEEKGFQCSLCKTDVANRKIEFIDYKWWFEKALEFKMHLLEHGKSKIIADLFDEFYKKVEKAIDGGSSDIAKFFGLVGEIHEIKENINFIEEVLQFKKSQESAINRVSALAAGLLDLKMEK